MPLSFSGFVSPIKLVTGAMDGVSRFRNDFYIGTLQLTKDLNTSLTRWVDNLKGKSENPDAYFPRENLQYILVIDETNTKLFQELCKIGAELRDSKDNPNAIKELETKLKLSMSKLAPVRLLPGSMGPRI